MRIPLQIKQNFEFIKLCGYNGVQVLRQQEYNGLVKEPFKGELFNKRLEKLS